MFLLFCTANHLMETFITYMALSEDDPPQTLPLGQYMTYGVTKLGHFQDNKTNFILYGFKLIDFLF